MKIGPRKDPKRHLLLQLRKRVKIYRPLDCRLVDARAKGGPLYEWTCKTCGHVWQDQVEHMAPELAAKFERYWQDGIKGSCPRCLKSERDKRYPLPPPLKEEAR